MGNSKRTGSLLFDLTVRDGEIMRASLGPPSVQFSAQVWIPFAEWVNANHPEHAAVTYNSPDADGARLTEEAFPLWEQHTQEYVQAVLTSPEAYAPTSARSVPPRPPSSASWPCPPRVHSIRSPFGTRRPRRSSTKPIGS